jgi:glycosyltransferase involved in cell wall biosynthesis
VRLLLRPAFRFLFSHPQARIIVHNIEDKRFLSRWLVLPPDRIVVTSGCGIDPIQFPFFKRRPTHRTNVILVPVRLLREKGVLDAVAASRILIGRGVQHEMWLSSYVDRANPSALERETVEDAAKGGNAKFLKFQRSLVPAYERCDIVCVPTKYPEGLPTALLEAAATGRPIVATDNVGCREFVRPGETGLMVPPGSPENLAEAIEKLITDSGFADRLRRNAHAQFLSTSTKDHMVQITVRVLRQLGLRLESGGHKAATLPVGAGSAANHRLGESPRFKRT